MRAGRPAYAEGLHQFRCAKGDKAWFGAGHNEKNRVGGIGRKPKGGCKRVIARTAGPPEYVDIVVGRGGGHEEETVFVG
jgi:hypothetical protein